MRKRFVHPMFCCVLSLFFWGCGSAPESSEEETESFGNGPKRHREAIWEEARLRGADFRARGNEPGWHLEIQPGGSSIFVTNYGEERIEFETPDPQSDSRGRTFYRVHPDGRDLFILVDDVTHIDTMSGEQFPTSVTVLLDGRKHEGGGKRLP